jgi:hypothetical protein
VWGIPDWVGGWVLGGATLMVLIGFYWGQDKFPIQNVFESVIVIIYQSGFLLRNALKKYLFIFY